MHAVSRRRFFSFCAKAGGLLPLGFGAVRGGGAEAVPQKADRAQWLEWLKLVAAPVLVAAQQRTLRRSMPVEAVAGHQEERAVGSALEALARLLAGLAPWLELDPSAEEPAAETALRRRYRGLAQEAIASAVDTGSPDYMRFGQSAQTLVDSSFLSLALLRAPRQLLASMNAPTRAGLVAALLSERTVQSPFSNWLLFAALNEVMLRKLDGPWDRLRIDYALREHQAWYVGDGTYGDGPNYHADFYNSYVIQPYLMAVLDGLIEEHTWDFMRPLVSERARRYAAIQERTISPAGEFPPIGRSLTYRAGAFHLLADMALRGQLPEGLNGGAVRAALTAVQRRTLTPAGTFSQQGWLQIGLAGHQPGLGETYISTGSLYLCSTAWLPLGLPAAHPFWTAPAADWTQKRIWSGADGTLDHALSEAAPAHR